jgi:hypothetical protein
MKRLLAYLFIVLGLGLTFSVNAEAEINYKFCDGGVNLTNGLKQFIIKIDK